ncbi:hypothetical protein [Spiroplasma mirum]|uniref:hypothetical protein n=1 Tax=Spiroplasma mirum TaxID=2144 RepID=UPI000B2BE975|nr:MULTISPECIES: hypothetical protein [Spiroplasma]
MLWLIPLLGFVVGMCAYACTKLARLHHSHNNGGAYIYVWTSCGRFWGIFVAFMQYVSLPFLIIFQILNLIRTSFGTEWVSQLHGIVQNTLSTLQFSLVCC